MKNLYITILQQQKSMDDRRTLGKIMASFNSKMRSSSEEFTAFVDIDENYQTSGVFTDQEICEQILEQNDTTETTIIDDESEEVIPTTSEALKMIHAIRLYCTTLPNADNLQAKIDSIENAIESQPKPRKQSSLIDFFRLAK